MLAWAMSPYFLDNAIISPTNTRHLLSESFFTVKGAALFLPRGNGTSSPRTGHRRSKHAADLQQHLHAMLNILRAEDNIKLPRLRQATLIGCHCSVLTTAPQPDI
uniref:protein phosphatase Slingshot homolog 2-like isoform X2 n=1 Tax=Myxine glutinosa TaxID=7769 RepID=UPI00358EF803